MKEMPSSPAKRWGLNLALTFGAILITLAAVELGLRIFWPLQRVAIRDAYRYDEQLGYRPKEKVDLVQVTDYRQELRTNRFGVPAYEESYDAYPDLIFALGDSYTEGVGVPQDASYPFQLALALNLNAEGQWINRYGIVNLGVSGYGLKQEMIVLKRYSMSLRMPKVVLYLGTENDEDDDLALDAGYPRKSLVDGSAYWGRWLGLVRSVDRLQVFQRIKVGIRQREMSNAISPNRAASGSSAERMWPRLKELTNWCQQNNVRIVLSWSQGDSSYEWLKARARSENIPFADWKSSTASISKVMPGIREFNDHSGGHFRTWVYRLIADSFAREIEGGVTH